jgi:hypothetical protein
MGSLENHGRMVLLGAGALYKHELSQCTLKAAQINTLLFYETLELKLRSRVYKIGNAESG